MSEEKNNSAFSMIADIEGDFSALLEGEMPQEVPILPVRNLVLFPGVVSPIIIARESSMKLVRKAEKQGSLIGIVCQKDPDIEMPVEGDLHSCGVYAKVLKQLTLPTGMVTVIVQGMGRLKLLGIKSEFPYLTGEVEPFPEMMPDKHDKEWRTAIDDLRRMADEYISISDDIPDEAMFAIHNIRNNVMALNFVCSNMPLSTKEKIGLLTVESVKERLFGTMKALNREINLQNLKADIRNKTREDLDEQQKNYFLQQQIKNLKAAMNDGG